MALVPESKIRQMVDTIVKRFHPKAVFLFGSYAKNQAGPDSDVDFLVIKDRIETSRSREMIDILRALELFRVPVDVMVADQAYVDANEATPGTIYFEIKNERKLVYGR